MEDKKTQIIFTSTSPYYIVNGKNIVYKNETIEDLKSVTAICRCGQSKSMPYCDGYHEKAGLRTEKSEDRVENKWKDYTGEDITVHFNLGLCSHGQTCLHGLPDVFNIDEKPWINVDKAPVDEVIDGVRKCPSGALTYTKDGNHITEFDYEENITIVDQGPLVIKGNVELVDDRNSLDELVSKNRFTLCRCGKSKNKPFCDGGHFHKE